MLAINHRQTVCLLGMFRLCANGLLYVSGDAHILLSKLTGLTKRKHYGQSIHKQQLDVPDSLQDRAVLHSAATLSVRRRSSMTNFATTQLRLPLYASWLTDMVAACAEKRVLHLLQHQFELPVNSDADLLVLEEYDSVETEQYRYQTRTYHTDLTVRLLQSITAELKSYLPLTDAKRMLPGSRTERDTDSHILRFQVKSSTGQSLGQAQLFSAFEQFIRDIQEFNPRSKQGGACETSVYRIVLSRESAHMAMSSSTSSRQPLETSNRTWSNSVSNKTRSRKHNGHDKMDDSDESTDEDVPTTVARKCQAGKRKLHSTQPQTAHSLKVHADLIGTTEKTFDTLYLRHDDMQRLRAVLHLFHHKKEHLKKLGLPYRLGLMLSGPPVCA